jgi:hypothetical protein
VRARIALIPFELLCHHPELDDKVGAEVLGLGFAALFPPQP